MAKTKAGPAQPPPPTTAALIISRNKHWRYISSFHGPWLQLPLELLESLAHQNFHAPPPHPIDPAVFYDLVKIRKAVDEAANLAVRATCQTNAQNAYTKLSRERKHRMRDLATQKLSHAYHLDEIAASVATMQSASTLENVAQFVLQRSAADHDAKYVHFFHEKIPSRSMAEYTPLDPLNDIIADRPSDASPLRTRALTRLFKKDYLGAVRDLTDGLAVARYIQQQHRTGVAHTAREKAEARRANNREWRNQPVKEEDQPSSLETQLLFHRAGVYFTLACQHVHEALRGLKDTETQRVAQQGVLQPGTEPPPLSLGDKEAHRNRLENRKLVKTYAKRALRDYGAFLSHFDYTSGLDPAITGDFFCKVNDAANDFKDSKSSYGERVQKLTDSPSEANGQTPGSVIPCQRRKNEPSSKTNANWSLPPPEIHQVSALFSSAPPPNLPPYPPPHARAAPPYPNPAITAFAEAQEAVTYHPLLTDALHSLLLCHALLQTPPTELRRHAHNAARVARVCDGHPVFLPGAGAAAARSPARADWLEVLHRVGSGWIGLAQPWEQLCSRSPLYSTSTAPRKQEQHQDEDEETAARASSSGNGSSSNSTALPLSASSSSSSSPDNHQPRRWAQENAGRDYCPSPISTARAEAVARWVRGAPLSGGGAGEGGAKRRKGGGRKKRGDVVRLEESECQVRQGGRVGE